MIFLSSFTKLKIRAHFQSHYIFDLLKCNPRLSIKATYWEENDPKRKLKLLFANKSQKDILLKEELEHLKSVNPNLELHFIIDKVLFDLDDSWNGLVCAFGWVRKKRGGMV